jgi:hypothetical protein
MFRIKTQLSVVIENRPGILTGICDALASHNVNIEGFSAYGETEHGIVRLVTDDPDRATSILADRGFLVTRGEVLAAKLPNRPAGLLRIARRLAEQAINIDYAYGSAAQAGRMATLYLKVGDPQRAASLLGAGKRPARAAASPTKAAASPRAAGHGDEPPGAARPVRKRKKERAVRARPGRR